jgi:hypothetical protein
MYFCTKFSTIVLEYIKKRGQHACQHATDDRSVESILWLNRSRAWTSARCGTYLHAPPCMAGGTTQLVEPAFIILPRGRSIERANSVRDSGSGRVTHWQVSDRAILESHSVGWNWEGAGGGDNRAQDPTVLVSFLFYLIPARCKMFSALRSPSAIACRRAAAWAAAAAGMGRGYNV